MSLKGSQHEKIESLTVPVMSEKSVIKEIFSSALVFCLNPDPLEINRHQSLSAATLAPPLLFFRAISSGFAVL